MNAVSAREYLERLQVFGIKLGLDNIRALLSELGDPQSAFPSVHIAGTNGKGSTASMIAAMLRAQGWRTGLYTSPHLVRVEERIRVDGRMITPGEFRACLERVRSASDKLMAEGRLSGEPTFFEGVTAVAFLHLARKKVEIAVIETGMGGRFDATNVLRPLVSVITTISRDHEMHLGKTLGGIAFEKAGIIKEGTPVVCGTENREALTVIRRKAREMHAPFIRVFGPGTRFADRRKGGKFRAVYSTDGRDFPFVPGLAGRHQGRNGAVAVAAALALGRAWRPLSRKSILGGLSHVEWEGRLETVCRRPLVVLDGAHNPEGAESLAGYIKEALGGPVVLVFAAMKDKDIGRMTRLLFPLAERVVLTKVPMERAADPEDIARLAGPGGRPFMIEPDTKKAVELGLLLSGGRRPVVIAGSLFLVGEIKRLKLFKSGL